MKSKALLMANKDATKVTVSKTARDMILGTFLPCYTLPHKRTGVRDNRKVVL